MHRLHRLHMMVERGTGITLGPTLEPPRNAIEADPTSEAGFDVLHEPTDQVDLELNSSVRMRAHVCSYVCDAQKTETSSVALANRLDELLDDAFEGANAERFGHETRQVRERSALVSGHAPVAPSWGSTDFASTPGARACRSRAFAPLVAPWWASGEAERRIPATTLPPARSSRRGRPNPHPLASTRLTTPSGGPEMKCPKPSLTTIVRIALDARHVLVALLPPEAFTRTEVAP